MSRLISMDEVNKHNGAESMWTVIDNKVYDITDFVSIHPGGDAPLLAGAGKDNTTEFYKIHNNQILNMLPKGAYVGNVDESTIKDSDRAVLHNSSSSSTPPPTTKPPLEQILNIYDFESIASKVMTKEGWDYYSSGADDEITLRENHAAFQRIWLKPRILVDVKNVDLSTKILGYESSIPLYLTATALGKLAHPDGEVAITRAAYKEGVIYMCPTLASYSLEEIMAAKGPGQVQFYQLYIKPDRQRTYEIVKQAEKVGCKVICLTVDAPRLGRRERDMRNKFSANAPATLKADKIERNKGTVGVISRFVDSSFNWKDLVWLKSITNLPIVLKGVQCAEDALLAYHHGVAGIILSNHGGRQLDLSRSAIEILPSVTSALRSAGVPRTFEVWIDGGIRRGTDIFKAIALGATAVGIGRPVLYGLAAHGQQGVEHVVRLFKEELEMCMALMGVTKIEQITQHYLCTSSLEHHFTYPRDHLREDTYIKLTPVPFSKL